MGGRVLTAFFLLLVAAAAAAATVDGVTAIYNFGDSLSDTGNLVREGATGLLQYIGRLPYGVDFPGGGRPTGRCFDGYLMIDFLAEDLGLPLLNPYLDKAADFTHGVNFAVAGATAVSTPALAERGITGALTNSSLGVQLQWFKDFMSSTANSTQEIRRKLASSLVMLGEIGGNDYNYAFLQSWPAGGGYGLGNVTRMVEAVAQAAALVPAVVQAITDAAKELLEMGATRLVIPGNFPLGCVPSYLAAANVTAPAAYDADGCLAALNGFAELHNAQLRGAVAALRAAYPRAAVVAYADYYAAYLGVLRDARAARGGFDAATALAACCGAGAGAGAYGVDVAAPGRFCGAPGAARACADPARYVSWDGVHLTQHAYGAMAEMLFRGGLTYPAPIRWPPAREAPGGAAAGPPVS